ncbi:hypothetical protein VPHD479_0229 [Vibrio phage D479]
MKKLLLALMVASPVLAHSQFPSTFGGPDNPLDAVSTKPVTVVSITLGNLNDYPQAYDIEIDGDIKGQTDLITGGTSVELKVPVGIDKPNTPETHKVCTLSVPQEGAMFRTRICTKAQVYWSKK